MIFYRCTIDDPNWGYVVSWHSNYAAARRHWQKNTAEFGWSYPPISSTLRGYDWSDGRIEQCEIEPTKKDFLAWLNACFKTDNQ